MKPLRYANAPVARFGRVPGPKTSSPAGDRLTDLAEFGLNPGNLKARLYIPPALPASAPLVVVLHGCTQTAAGYDHGSGWSSVADRYGFALLYPEQQRANNPNLCFNWFVPGDCQRGAGEPHSIRQMIETVAASHGIDRQRIFVTGLSAGGAMAAVMLATYPEIFAGGAIIAGLPFGCAKTIPEAFERMKGRGALNDAELYARMRAASNHDGPWPTISIWHGSADETVDPANAEALLTQWRLVHRLIERPTRTESIQGYPRRVWCDAHGREVIEMYSITAMGHGTPLATRGSDGCGACAPYMLEANISSTRRIAGFWHLTRTDEVRAGKAQQADSRPAASPWVAGIAGIQKTISDALRAAGLMK
jgi:poly(hydroxyalkanoate) depolymerase family esterase